MITAEASSSAAPAMRTFSISSRGHGPPPASQARIALTISAPAVRMRSAAPTATSSGASGRLRYFIAPIIVPHARAGNGFYSLGLSL